MTNDKVAMDRTIDAADQNNNLMGQPEHDMSSGCPMYQKVLKVIQVVFIYYSIFVTFAQK